MRLSPWPQSTHRLPGPTALVSPFCECMSVNVWKCKGHEHRSSVWSVKPSRQGASYCPTSIPPTRTVCLSTCGVNTVYASFRAAFVDENAFDYSREGPTRTEFILIWPYLTLLCTTRFSLVRTSWNWEALESLYFLRQCLLTYMYGNIYKYWLTLHCRDEPHVPETNLKFSHSDISYQLVCAHIHWPIKSCCCVCVLLLFF